MNDPIRQFVHRLRLLRLVAGLMLAAAIVWALTPPTIEPETSGPPDFSQPPAQSDQQPSSQPDPLDARLFAVRLWNAPPEQRLAKAEAPEPPPAPPNVSLVGIISESGTLRAALYDIAADKLLVLKQGESIQRFTVQEISSEKVILSDGPRRHELRLRESVS